MVLCFHSLVFMCVCICLFVFHDLGWAHICLWFLHDFICERLELLIFMGTLTCGNLPFSMTHDLPLFWPHTEPDEFATVDDTNYVPKKVSPILCQPLKVFIYFFCDRELA